MYGYITQEQYGTTIQSWNRIHVQRYILLINYNPHNHLKYLHMSGHICQDACLYLTTDRLNWVMCLAMPPHLYRQEVELIVDTNCHESLSYSDKHRNSCYPCWRPSSFLISIIIACICKCTLCCEHLQHTKADIVECPIHMSMHIV